MKTIDELYKETIEIIEEIEDRDYKNREDLVNFILSNLPFDSKFLNSPEVYVRIDTLVNTSNAIISTIEAIACVLDISYEISDIKSLKSCYSDALYIDDLYYDYEDYQDTLLSYQDCIEEFVMNHFALRNCNNTYDNYIELITRYFELVEEEKNNNAFAKENQMRLVKKDRKLVSLGRKYLKKLEE